MKWPVYIRVQRQEQILKQRLKVPSAIALFIELQINPLQMNASDCSKNINLQPVLKENN